MRTERVLHAFKAEGDWRQVEALRRTEPTPYVGRAVVAPVRDGRGMRESAGRSSAASWHPCTASPYLDEADPPPFRVPPTAHG